MLNVGCLLILYRIDKTLRNRMFNLVTFSFKRLKTVVHFILQESLKLKTNKVIVHKIFVWNVS